MTEKRLCIIGGGLVGLATAWQLRRLAPGFEVTVLEKEPGFGRHQSTHNSGVLHAGLYYKPGSVKARMAVSGIRLMTEFCRQHRIAHEICGNSSWPSTTSKWPGSRRCWNAGRKTA
jgi:L-2-hydroxyglutarate oxidase